MDRGSPAGSDKIGSGYPPYSADYHLQGTKAVTVKLLHRPEAVTRRLASRLLRALGNGQDQEHQRRPADATT